VVSSNDDTALHRFRDTVTFTVYMIAYDLPSKFSHWDSIRLQGLEERRKFTSGPRGGDRPKTDLELSDLEIWPLVPFN